LWLHFGGRLGIGLLNKYLLLLFLLFGLLGRLDLGGVLDVGLRLGTCLGSCRSAALEHTVQLCERILTFSGFGLAARGRRLVGIGVFFLAFGLLRGLPGDLFGNFLELFLQFLLFFSLLALSFTAFAFALFFLFGLLLEDTFFESLGLTLLLLHFLF